MAFLFEHEILYFCRQFRHLSLRSFHKLLVLLMPSNCPRKKIFRFVILVKELLVKVRTYFNNTSKKLDVNESAACNVYRKPPIINLIHGRKGNEMRQR